MSITTIMLSLGQDCQEIISEDTANPFTSHVIYLNERFCFYTWLAF